MKLDNVENYLKHVKMMHYCNEDISKIENYSILVNDNDFKNHKWCLHHKLEITKGYSRE